MGETLTQVTIHDKGESGNFKGVDTGRVLTDTGYVEIIPLNGRDHLSIALDCGQGTTNFIRSSNQTAERLIEAALLDALGEQGVAQIKRQIASPSPTPIGFNAEPVAPGNTNVWMDVDPMEAFCAHPNIQALQSVKAASR